MNILVLNTLDDYNFKTFLRIEQGQNWSSLALFAI